MAGEEFVPEPFHPIPGKILTLPRTRRISLTAMALEFSHQLVLALWIGSLVATTSLAVPALLDTVPDPGPAARACLDLMGRLGLIGLGAGSYLLLTTSLMYFLSLRQIRTLALQAAFLLSMSMVTVATQVWLAPHLFGLLRANPDLLTGGSAGADLSHFRTLFGSYLGCLLLQATLGAVLMLAGVRRWYHYGQVSSSTGPPD
jgi:hypothetical protein